MNKVFLTGICGKEPVCTITNEANKSIAKFSLAVKSPTSSASTEWFNITTFNNIESFVKPFVHKGSKLAIVGRLTTSTYEKEGKKYYNTGILAEMIELTGNKKNEEDEIESSEQVTAEATSDTNKTVVDDTDEDLPF